MAGAGLLFGFGAGGLKDRKRFSLFRWSFLQNDPSGPGLLSGSLVFVLHVVQASGAFGAGGCICFLNDSGRPGPVWIWRLA